MDQPRQCRTCEDKRRSCACFPTIVINDAQQVAAPSTIVVSLSDSDITADPFDFQFLLNFGIPWSHWSSVDTATATKRITGVRHYPLRPPPKLTQVHSYAYVTVSVYISIREPDN